MAGVEVLSLARVDQLIDSRLGKLDYELTFRCDHRGDFPAAMEKRLTRAKQAIAESKSLFDLDLDEAVTGRLPVIRRTLYLLFNEGYHGASPISAIRSELCRESMRLTNLVLSHPQGATPTTYALAALMCFRAIAFGQLHEPEAGLKEILSILDADRLCKYPFYPAAIGEFEHRCGRIDIAIGQFQIAQSVSRNAMEREYFERQIHCLTMLSQSKLV